MFSHSCVNNGAEFPPCPEFCRLGAPELLPNNWRGRPLVSREVIVNLIGSTTTESGLQIRSQLDANSYEAGIKVSDEELAKLAIERDQFHGEWNYRFCPREESSDV
jgi:hypothetical protein